TALAQNARVVDDVAADDGEDRSNLLEVLVWYGEVIAVENDEVGQLAFLDGSQLILLAQEPPIPLRVELQDFPTRDLLVGVDQHASCVQAGCGKVHVEPRIHRRDLHAIRAHAGVDATVDDESERRTCIRRDGPCGQGSPAGLPPRERTATAAMLPPR